MHEQREVAVELDSAMGRTSGNESAFSLGHNSQARNTERSGSMMPADNGASLSSLVRKATGPRTAKGKDRSRHNACKHGIFSNVAVLSDEPRSEFDSLLSGLRRDFTPKGTLEVTLVEKLAILLWRYRRLLIAEVEEFGKDPLYDPEIKLHVPRRNVLDHPDRLLRYDASLERSFDRTLRHLERIQRTRLGQPVLPELEVHHSLG